MTLRRLANPAFLAAMALFGGAAAGLTVAIGAMGAHLQKLPIYPAGPGEGPKFVSLPRSCDGWQQVGVDPQLSAEVIEELGTRNSVSRVYQRTSPGGKPLSFELHCAYYTGTIDTVPHVPERCYVGGGMNFDGDSVVVPVKLDLTRFPPDKLLDAERYGGLIRRGRTLEGLHVHMPRGLETLSMNVTPYRDQNGRRLFAGYFFLANGGTVPLADNVRLLAYQIKERYAYYAKVQFMSGDVDSAQELADVAADFLNVMFPDIMQRVPDWVDVTDGRYPPGTEGSASESTTTDGSPNG